MSAVRPVNSPLLAEPGAVAADGPDAGVAAHYGDPYAEQRALAGRYGVVDRSHRGVLRISGPDRLSWLHSLTTQQLDQLRPGTSAEALVLSPQGHVEHQLSLTDDGAAIWAHVEPGTIGPLLEFLTSMKFMLRVEPEDITADYAVLSLLGPDVPAELPAAGARMRTGFGTDLIVPRAELAAAVAALRAGRSGARRHVGLRGAPDRRRPSPAGPGYRPPDDPARGRLDRDGGAPEQGLLPRAGNGRQGAQPRPSAAAARPAAPGWQRGQAALARRPGLLGETAAGVTGSAARHYELGPIALALVKRTTPVAATLTVDGIAAAQEVIVSPDAGANIQLSSGVSAVA